MRMKHYAVGLLSLLFVFGAFSAELSAVLKTRAEEYDKAQKGFDASVAAQKKMARDGYLAVLGATRKREESAKRLVGVEAINAEMDAVNAGEVGGKPPEKLPPDLKTYRDRFIAAMKRAETSNDSVRKNSREQYLKWLAGTEAQAAKVKDEALLAAVRAEKKRVEDAAPKGETPGK